MNRKGFTLIELIAVIVILGIILVISAPSLIDTYKASKLKTEEIFIERLSQSIDNYVKLNSSEIVFSKTEINAQKEYINSEGKTEKSYPEIKEGKINDKFVTVQNIIDDELISEEDYINPGNKIKSCSTNAEIEIYKDSDYVYCYKVKKDSLDCLTDEYKESLTGDYAIDTCIWTEVK